MSHWVTDPCQARSQGYAIQLAPSTGLQILHDLAAKLLAYEGWWKYQRCQVTFTASLSLDEFEICVHDGFV